MGDQASKSRQEAEQKISNFSLKEKSKTYNTHQTTNLPI
jgi:hypothetical protein